jgi:hypothetical protein
MAKDLAVRTRTAKVLAAKTRMLKDLVVRTKMQKVLAAKALAAEIPKKAKSPGNSARRSPRQARAFSFVCFARKNQQCAFRL